MKILDRRMALVVLGLGLAVGARAAEVGGKWTATFDSQIGEQRYTYDLKAEGDRFSGTAESNFGKATIQEGVVKGDDVSFVELLDFQGQTLRIEYRGKITGDEMKLTRTVGDFGSESLVAKRAK